MPLVFAAITPHSPLLIPTIGRDEHKKLSVTKQALVRLEQDLYLAKPQLIIVLSPHVGIFETAFTVNASPVFQSDFETFGDVITKKEWPGAPEIAAKIVTAAKHMNLPVRQVSEEKVDHATSIPLYYLTAHLDGRKILPIGFSNHSRADHLRFGNLLRDIISQPFKRVAVIASGDLSRAEGTGTYDEQILGALKRNQLEDIVTLSEPEVLAAEECSYRTLLILQGIIKDIHTTWEIYSYEKPFGVGHVVANCRI